MKATRFVSGVLLALSLAGGVLASQAAPSVHAARLANLPIGVVATCIPCHVLLTPQLTISADHQSIAANGANFFTSGRPVYLYAYGTNGGVKNYLTYTAVTPAISQSPNQYCFVGCTVGSFWTETTQANDPCVGAGYSQLEVDAWTTDSHGAWYEAATATTIAGCSVAPR